MAGSRPHVFLWHLGSWREEVVKNALVTQAHCANVSTSQLMRFLELRMENIFSCHIYILKKPV